MAFDRVIQSLTYLNPVACQSYKFFFNNGDSIWGHFLKISHIIVRAKSLLLIRFGHYGTDQRDCLIKLIY